jgi:type I restriction enzyme M protein
LKINVESITNYKSIEFFNVIVTNPPFGTKIPIQDQQILEQFELAHIWEKQADGSWVMQKKLKSSVPPEQLFIERVLQLLKGGGRTAIVLPDSILGSPGLEYIRQWLIHKTKIIASIDLHADTFQPHNGTQCSILFLQKKTQKEIDAEEKSGQIIDYNIFMAMIDHIGHDKRGNKIYKRDEEGNVIVKAEEKTVTEKSLDGSLVYRTEMQQEKIINDQTVLVADVFEKWKREEGIQW